MALAGLAAALDAAGEDPEQAAHHRAAALGLLGPFDDPRAVELRRRIGEE